MPSALTYPGVYVEEIPSGVRTITGVATSIAAFVGRTRRGPIDTAVTITSFADFERRFGGLHSDYPMAFAVRDFFQNGGATAIIVRSYGGGGSPPKAAFDAPIPLVASSPGTWANAVRVRVDQTDVIDATKYYNVRIHDPASGITETFTNVTFNDSPRRVDRVLVESDSMLRYDATGGAPSALPAKFNKALAAGASVWDDVPSEASFDVDKQFSTKVKTAAADTNEKALWSDGSPGTQGTTKTRLYALDAADLFNLLVIPPDTIAGDVPVAILQQGLEYCRTRRAMLIVDPPDAWNDPDSVKANPVNLTGDTARNAAVYFPRVLAQDLDGSIKPFPPGGMVAGIMARTDTTRGVWKAPAGVDAALSGAQGLEVKLSDRENGLLNPLGINCLRTFPIFGSVVWGARTMRGADQAADEYKYIPVRRLALFIEESLYRGLQWVVFEPNDEPLWSQIRLNAGAFMNGLFRQGAFQGSSSREAYFVKCDKDTTTQNDINLGIVNIIVGFAPLKPAEFVVLKIQQIAGQIQT